MDWLGLTRNLLAAHVGRPQEEERIRHAIREAREALEVLGSLGHQFHLEDGPGWPLPSWPKVLFHASSAPNGRLVASPWEADDLGEGWYETLGEAQHENGRAVQDAGRGGIHRRALPVVISPAPSPEELALENRQAISAARAAFRKKKEP